MTPHGGRAFSSCSSSTRSPQQQAGWNGPSDVLCHHCLLRCPSSLEQYGQRGPIRRSCLIRQSGLVSNATRRVSSVSPPLTLTLLLVLLLCLCPGTAANNAHHPAKHMELHSEFVYDRSERPVLPVRRQEDSSSSSSSGPADGASATVSGMTVASPTVASSLPKPFDTNLGNNFTAQSCPDFFQSFLSNETFNNCLPFSLLLQTSNSFFTASQSLVRLTQTLDASCSVNFSQCSTLMTSLGHEIQQQSNCGADFQLQNPMVAQAYNGFLAYDALYHAGCLQDSNGDYCFSDAITNTSAPTGSYIYYLPLGLQLPAATRPTCDACLKNTMEIFASSASNGTQPMASDYSAAAQQIDMGCGPTFVEAAVSKSGAMGQQHPAIALSFLVPLILALGYLI